LIDFLGHGYSDKPSDFAYTVEEHARTVVALIDRLDLTDCGLVGHRNCSKHSRRKRRRTPLASERPTSR
jgi:hypothetical protein